MPRLVPGIHALLPGSIKDTDGRDKPGRDDERSQAKDYYRRPNSVSISLSFSST